MIPASMHIYASSSDKDGIKASQHIQDTIRCVGQLETFQSGTENVDSHVTKYWPLIGRKGKGRFLTPVRWYDFDP